MRTASAALAASAALIGAAAAQGAPPADFGAPPSGAYPIIFNDHHVYAKPSQSRKDRVVAALVRGNTVLVPLRSMFEQMGATVAYDPQTRTIDVSKPGADIKLAVGKPEIVINGESRPLDVAPILVRGTVLVPVRVISEGMGAYVAWVPAKKTVVVRYVAAPPPTPPPSAPPLPPPLPTVPKATLPPATPAPTPTPAPVQTPVFEKFVVGDYAISPKVYNEFSPGNTGKSSFAGRAGIEFPAAGITWMLEGDWRHWSYPHTANDAAAVCPDTPGTTGCVTTIGQTGQTYVSGFSATDDDGSARLGFRFASPRFYLGGSYLWLHNNYGYPTLTGAGFGAEKLPDLDRPLTFYGSVWYYPNVRGSLAGGSTLAYRLTTYQIGIDWNPFGGASPAFIDLGFNGDQLGNKTNAPANANFSGAYAGIGLHF